MKELIEKLRQEQEQVIVSIPAPTPDTTNTPQDILNRTVAVITKVNDRISVKASTDLSNVNVGTTYAGKVPQVNASGEFDFVSKQDTLTKTIQLIADDNTTIDIKVG